VAVVISMPAAPFRLGLQAATHRADAASCSTMAQLSFSELVEL
jgi:hypothetical protein